MKTCKHCATPFTPVRPLQAVCSARCAGRLVKEQKKAEIATTRARKQALKRIPDLIREAQTEFNKWVRARDHAQPCISCGKPPGDMTQLHAGRDAGHYRSTGSAAHLRFHEDNCHAQCVQCNQWKAGNAVDYRLGLLARIGVKRVEALEADNKPHKWTREQLENVKQFYRTKLKALQAERTE